MTNDLASPETSTALTVQPVTPLTDIQFDFAEEIELLKQEALELWEQHNDCEERLGPILYNLCTALHAPGEKGKGFAEWLKQHKKPRATAYRLIKRYALAEKLELPFIQKKKRLSHLRQGQTPVTQTEVAQISGGLHEVLDSIKNEITLKLETVGKAEQNIWAGQLIDWLTDQYMITQGHHKAA